MNSAQHILIFTIKLYQRALSPAMALFSGPFSRCRFEPSCSEYAAQAVRVHGAIVGAWLGAKRICRCHPWGGCGDDPVPPRSAMRAGLRLLGAHKH